MLSKVLVVRKLRFIRLIITAFLHSKGGARNGGEIKKEKNVKLDTNKIMRGDLPDYCISILRCRGQPNENE